MLYHWSEIVFAIGFVAYILIRGKYIRRTRSIETVSRQIDTIERMLFVLVFLGNLFVPLVYLLTPFLSFADYPLPEWLRVCGAILMAFALWLFWRSHEDLGDNWSVTLEIRKEHRLVTAGVYRFIRHPMYAAILLFGIAQVLLLPNWLAGWSAFVSFAIMYLVRVAREERMMTQVFGDAYQDYSRRTGRIIPRLIKIQTRR